MVAFFSDFSCKCQKFFVSLRRKRRNNMKRTILVLLLMLATATMVQAESKGTLFFFRMADRIDRFLLQRVDTNYITLPENSWRVALNAGMLGINSTMQSTSNFEEIPEPLTISLLSRTTPSADLGFYAGYRSLGFSYSWDLLHAYAQRLNFSLGAKFIGIDFSYQTSNNITTRMAVNNVLIPSFTTDNAVTITNANLNVWYALNSAHYSPYAAVKQSFIQRKTAGSLMLHLSYMSSRIAFGDTILIEGADRPTFSTVMSEVRLMNTRQVAVGIGYGINYTPNHGKVLLHLSAAAMMVCYSVNHISYYVPDSLRATLPGEPMYVLRSAQPVHVTGNVRAAVSWEINKWVHLSAWATGDNIRFYSEKTYNANELFLSNWNWKVQLTLGVRLGVGRTRIREALKDDPAPPTLLVRTTNLPQWFTDYFYSPKL